jgi:acyl carrier protein
MEKIENKKRTRSSSYKRHHKRIAREVMLFTSSFYNKPVAEISEDSTFEELKRNPHDTIVFMLEAEDRFQFEFPDDLKTKRGKLKVCRADTIKTLKEMIDYISRLPGNSPKAEQDGKP